MAEAAVSEYAGTGRRKTSVAQVRLTNGNGKVTINDRKLEDYITTPSMRTHALLPLEVTENARKYDVTVTVCGGGPNGQAGAIRLGIARALLRAQAVPVLETISATFHLPVQAPGLIIRGLLFLEKL